MTEAKKKTVEKEVSAEDVAALVKQVEGVCATVRLMEAKMERHTAKWKSVMGKLFSKAALPLALVACMFATTALAVDPPLFLLKGRDASRTEVFKVSGDGDGTCTVTITGSVTTSESMTFSAGLTVTAGGITITDGDITLDNDEYIDNDTDGTVKIINGGDQESLTLSLETTLTTNGTVTLGLKADADGDAGDWFAFYNNGQGTLSIQSDASVKGTLADKITISSAGNVDIVGGTLAVGSTLTADSTIELGHATENTLSASSGTLSIEGNVCYRAGGTDVPVTDGGTGVGTLTDGGILLGNGTGALVAMAALADGSIVVGDGTTDPVALAAFSSSTGDLLVTAGGTGVGTLTTNGVLVGAATSAIQALAAGTDGQVLVGDTGANPAFVTLSGDITTVSAAGAVALADGAVPAAEVGAGTLPADVVGVAGSFAVATNATVAGTVTSAGARTTTSGAKAGATVSVVEKGNDVFHQTVITMTSTPIVIDGTVAVGFGGTKIYDFPEGYLWVQEVVCNISTTVLGVGVTAGAGGDYGLGTAVNANADLSDATDVDLLASQDRDPVANAWSAKLGTAAAFDGATTAKDVFINGLIDNEDIATICTNLISGTVTITWIDLGDDDD